MKIRTDFVTNSSSSSYCTIRVDSPKLAEAIAELYEISGVEPPDPDDYEAMTECGVPFLIDGDTITQVPVSEHTPFTSAPHGVEDAVSMIVSAAGEAMEDTCYDPDEVGRRLSELKEQLGTLAPDVRSIEWDYYDSGWGGEADWRFDRAYYEPDDLKMILGSIAKEKGCMPEDVTDGDFNSYVGPKRCDTHESFSFSMLNHC